MPLPTLCWVRSPVCTLYGNDAFTGEEIVGTRAGGGRKQLSAHFAVVYTAAISEGT